MTSPALRLVALLLIAGSAEAAAPSFRHDVMAVLSRSGCNQGTCHGNQNGKGGLKLSLRGQDASRDYRELTHGLSGRRINSVEPAASLLLQKPAMQIPHEGGKRFALDSREYDIFKRWIEAGHPDDPADLPRLTKLEVSPRQLTTVAGSEPVPLKVTAHFSNDTTRDVTQLAVYESSSIAVTVSPEGVASCDKPELTTISVRYLNRQAPVRLEFIANRPNFVFDAPEPANRIDELVFQQLERLKMNPSPVSDDSTFLRRVYLDLTGLLPPVSKAREFVASSDPNKRAAVIDELLSSEEFVDQQAQRWADLLRAEEKTLDATGLKTYHEWIRECVEADKPLNEWAAELISARGSTYKVPATNFFRALRTPEERAESTAQMMLGVRLTCAKCHNHPFDRWTQDDYYGWSNFFARIDYEIIENKRRDKSDKHEFVGEQIVKIKPEGEVTNVRTGKPAGLRFLGEAKNDVQETAESDRLQELADWIRSPENRRFAATQANRLWNQVMGLGVVDPIDDFRDTNPPVNPELLQLLTDELIAGNFSSKHLLRLILNSRTYQLSSVPNATNADDERCFSHCIPRRLTAEQTLDAITGALETSVRFGGHDVGTRAVQLIGVRNGEFRYAKPEVGDQFLKLFGRPNRLQSCECERSNETTLAQTFEMVSGEVIAHSLSANDNRIAQAVSSDQTFDEFLDGLYWSALTRAPTEQERLSLGAYVDKAENRRAALTDIAWAVLNSNEFLLRR